MAASAAVAVGMGPLDAFSLSLFNVPVNVIFLAFLGAALSNAYSDDPPSALSKPKLYVILLANTLISTACVAVLPQALGWSWYNSKIEGSVAFLLAMSARFAIPLLIKTFPEILRRWFKLGEYNDGGSSRRRHD